MSERIDSEQIDHKQGGEILTVVERAQASVESVLDSYIGQNYYRLNHFVSQTNLVEYNSAPFMSLYGGDGERYEYFVLPATLKAKGEEIKEWALVLELPKPSQKERERRLVGSKERLSALKEWVREASTDLKFGVVKIKATSDSITPHNVIPISEFDQSNNDVPAQILSSFEEGLELGKTKFFGLEQLLQAPEKETRRRRIAKTAISILNGGKTPPGF
jgi:hypothetical protein